MICLIYFNSNSINIHEHMSQSLHALEYPATSSQLSLVSFRTPGLPPRLASTWEIQNELHMTPDTLASVYDMLYPTMENTIGMHEQLREHTPTNCIAYDGCSVLELRGRQVLRRGGFCLHGLRGRHVLERRRGYGVHELRGWHVRRRRARGRRSCRTCSSTGCRSC
jgi:hypothetical protein